MIPKKTSLIKPTSLQLTRKAVTSQTTESFPIRVYFHGIEESQRTTTTLPLPFGKAKILI